MHIKLWRVMDETYGYPSWSYLITTAGIFRTVVPPRCFYEGILCEASEHEHGQLAPHNLITKH